jgi:hypothetical protein
MKRMSAVLAVVAMLALGVAGPAGAAPGGKGPNKGKIVCTIQSVNPDGSVTQTCTNTTKVGTEDGATETEVDRD